MTSIRYVLYTIRHKQSQPTYYYMDGTVYYSSWRLYDKDQPSFDVAIAKLKLLEKIYGHKKDDLILQAKRIGMLL